MIHWVIIHWNSSEIEYEGLSILTLPRSVPLSTIHAHPANIIGTLPRWQACSQGFKCFQVKPERKHLHFSVECLATSMLSLQTALSNDTPTIGCCHGGDCCYAWMVDEWIVSECIVNGWVVNERLMDRWMTDGWLMDRWLWMDGWWMADGWMAG